MSFADGDRPAVRFSSVHSPADESEARSRSYVEELEGGIGLDREAGRRRPSVVRCDVSRVSPNLGTVETLARLRVTVQRGGGRVELSGASVELLDLLAFCGLPFRLALEAERLAEEREEARGVQEERDPADPIA